MLFAIILSGEALAFPVARRQDSDQLALDIEPGFLPEAHSRQKPRRDVDVRIVGKEVIVRVARDDDRFVHVDGAVSARLVVAETMRLSGDLKKSRIENRLRRSALARIQ